MMMIIIIISVTQPYVKLHFGKEKKKTEIIKKTLNPVYNQQFQL